MAARTKPTSPLTQELNWYGLPMLGYKESVILSGNHLQDQLAIEGLCFRIGHLPAEGGLGKFGHYKNCVDLTYNHPDRQSFKKFLWHDWAIRASRAFCDELEVTLAGSASSGKTNPAALWGVMNYLLDPTHVKVVTLTTTIKEAKDRIWKEVMEFWDAVPNGPGKLLKSFNQIQGLSFDGVSYGTTSGITLAAADKSNEASGVNSMIGSKVAKTGTPGRTAEDLLDDPEYADLKQLPFDREQLLNLVLRLQEISEDRLGKLIVIVDEATGVSEKVLDAYLSNLKPGNTGRVQLIVIGNPSSHFDMHGLCSEPDAGWGSINTNSTEWRTKTGGVCLHFDGEKNPRIVTGNSSYIWMPTEAANKEVEDKYGRESYEYYRMVRGFWAPEGATNAVYSEVDFTNGEALHTGTGPQVVWGFQPPKKLAGFDPAFTSGGDRAVIRFGLLGVNITGRHVLELTEEVTVKADINDLVTPVPKQLALRFKHECQKRGVPPDNACFDASGGGISFGALITQHWSSRVRAVTSGGKASEKPIPGEKTPDGKIIRGVDKFANRASEIWCAMVPFLRTGQIKGIPRDLAREICSRQKAKRKSATNLDKIQIEPKAVYKDREKHSPDSSDAALLVLNEAMARHGFKPDHKNATGETHAGHEESTASLTWKAFKDRARRISNRKNLKRG